MLDPDLVLSSLLSTARATPTLVAALNSEPTNISSHIFRFGTENSLARTVEQMPSGTLLLVYTGLIGGQFSGMSCWKHQLQVYIRPANSEASPAHLWWLLLHGDITGRSTALRNLRLLPSLSPMDLPSITFQQDATYTDLFVGNISIPEEGDE